MNNLEKLYYYLLQDDVSIYEDEIFKIIPELKYEKNFKQNNQWHIYDVWNHTLATVNACDNNKEDRLVLLLHDIGKPFCYQDEGMIRHFKNHAYKSYDVSKVILKRLSIEPNKEEEMIKLIKYHATNIDIDDINEDNINFYKRLLKIQRCDAMGYEEEHSKMLLNKLNYTYKLLNEK